MTILCLAKMENRSIYSDWQHVENTAYKCKYIFVWTNQERILNERFPQNNSDFRSLKS